MEVQKNVLLAPHTTFKIGGPAAFFVSVSNETDLLESLSYAHKHNRQIFVLGGGCNVLISDQGLDALVIKMETKGISFQHKGDCVEVTAAAGESWDALVAATVERGLWGIENLSAIPGTVGAAPVQNIGAYGVELSDTLCFVDVLDRETLKMKRLSAGACELKYRESVFQKKEGKRFIIVRIGIMLREKYSPRLEYRDLKDYYNSKNPSCAEVRQAIIEIRSRKFPNLADVGTAGCFFKNPIIERDTFLRLARQFPEMPHYPAGEKIKIPIAFLLERFGWRGVSRSAVGTHRDHALVVVNYGGATCALIESFVCDIVRDIEERTGIVLEREVLMIS